MTRHMMTIHPDEKYEDVVNILKPLLPQTNEQIQGVIKKTEKVIDEVNTDKDQTVNTGESNTIVAKETYVDAQSSANFIILENKLIQKPLQSPLDKELNGPQVYWKDGGKSLVQNQIQVITVLSTNYETGADHVNLIEVPFSDKLENGNEGTFNRVPHISHNWNDLKQQPVLENQIDLNSKLTPLGRSNEQQQPSDYNECKNTDIPRNTPSVIRSIGNVNKKLTAPQANDDLNEKANTTLEYDYKHKKYNHHYNVDLYRKILGCDDDSCHSEGHHREQVHHEASFETAIPTAVHWRKCFKNIYETSAT